MLTAGANIGALQNSRFAVRTYSRCAKGALTNDTHWLAAAARRTDLDGLLLFPAVFNVAAHARAGRHRDRPCLHVADDDAHFQYIHPLCGLDIALQFAADHDDARQDLSRQMGAGVDREITVDADIPLEPAGHAHIAGSF